MPEDTIVIFDIEIGKQTICPLTLLNPYVHHDLLQACAYTYEAALNMTTKHTSKYGPWVKICNTVRNWFRPACRDDPPFDIGEDFVEHMLHPDCTEKNLLFNPAKKTSAKKES
jgi:hypothetical protein